MRRSVGSVACRTGAVTVSAVTCGSVCETLESEVSVAINEAQCQRVVPRPKQGFPKAPPSEKGRTKLGENAETCVIYPSG